jgi:hypothetical protein
MKKITFTMTPNAKRPKHSTRFDFEKFDEHASSLEVDALDRFTPSFYIPKDFASHAKRIRVTIEEVE